jgi:hypothetical protein
MLLRCMREPHQIGGAMQISPLDRPNATPRVDGNRRGQEMGVT